MPRIPRHRLITLFGLTSLVATMVTITRYSSSYSEPKNRLLLTQQKLYEYQHSLRLIASEQNSNETINNLLDILVNQTVKQKQTLPNSDEKVDYKINQDKPAPVIAQSSSIMSSTNSPAQSIKINDKFNNNGNSIEIMPPLLENTNNINNYNDLNTNNFDIKTASSNAKTIEITEKPINANKPIRYGSNQLSDQRVDTKNILISDRSDANLINKNEINIDDIDGNPKAVKINISNDLNQKLNQSQIESQEMKPDIKSKNISFKPKLIFDAKDLQTTETMKIDKPVGCDTDVGASLDLLVIVNSAVGNWEARDAIRKTWGQFAVERGAFLFFLLGSTVDPELQKRVELEDKRREDILQGQYIDNYYNLTLKTISLVKWIADKCSKVKYVLKVDDDMFVNMQHIADFTETRTFNHSIIGKLAKKWKPHREKTNKWYVPYEAFNGTQFPNFATGPAYMLSGDAARPLYETSIKLKAMYLEDVYITGIVAESAGIKRLNHAMIRNTHIANIDECVFRKMMTSHKHSPQDIIRLWDVVYRQPPKVCESPKTRKPNAAPIKQLTNNRVITTPKVRALANG